MRTIPEVCDDIKSILNNIEWTDNCEGETIVDIDELVNEILMISTYKPMKQKKPYLFWKNDRFLYRAKREDNGMWAEGCLIYDNHEHIYRIVIDVDYSTGTHMYITSAPRIDKSTICQCTGIKDKNGKLICENDIVRHYNDNNNPEKYDMGILKWDNDNVRFDRTSIELKENVRMKADCVYEVIGNIFDNPPMWEVGE